MRPPLCSEAQGHQGDYNRFPLIESVLLICNLLGQAVHKVEWDLVAPEEALDQLDPAVDRVFKAPLDRLDLKELKVFKDSKEV